jgi:hypothetical protein
MAALMLAGPVAAQTAQVTTDRPAGYIVFPKIVSDPAGLFNGGTAMDTLIQITNTNNTEDRILHCFYVDGTTRCTNGASLLDPDGACRTNADCNLGGTCALQTCGGIDFDVITTPNQPVGWQASIGVQQTGICRGGTEPGTPCDVDGDCAGGGTCPPLNIGRVPNLAPGVFLGELKCVEVQGTETTMQTRLPINANDLIGNATIYEVLGGTGGTTVDVRSYNAIGVQSVSTNGAAQTDPTTAQVQMQLGGTNGEYAGCPAQLIINHFFDGAVVGNATVSTDVTFVPCSERPESEGDVAGDNDPTPIQLQFLVYNEFEQRFSASTNFRCFRETALSNLDRRPGQESTSIFNVAVQGTLAGQTVVRPVLSSTNPLEGNGVLAVAEEFHTVIGTANTHSAAFNVNIRGTKTQADFVIFTP